MAAILHTTFQTNLLCVKIYVINGFCLTEQVNNEYVCIFILLLLQYMALFKNTVLKRASLFACFEQNDWKKSDFDASNSAYGVYY